MMTGNLDFHRGGSSPFLGRVGVAHCALTAQQCAWCWELPAFLEPGVWGHAQQRCLREQLLIQTLGVE